MTTVGKNHLGEFLKSPEQKGDENNIPQGEENTDKGKDTQDLEGNENPEGKPEGKPEGEEKPKGEDNPGDESKPEGNDNPSGEESQKEIDEKAVIEFLKQRSNGKEFESIDDLFKTEEKDASNPFDKYSDNVKGFLKYHEETGRDYEDFKALSEDISKKSALELAREKAIINSGGKLTRDEVDAYLEHKLNIDLRDEEDIEKFDQIELDSYVKDFRDQKIKEQEKYLTPANSNKPDQENFVTLDNGTIVPKDAYEELGRKRQEYIENLKKSSDNIKGYELKLKIDDNGESKTYELGYDYSKDDKHNMVSSALDIDKSIESLFTTEEGFNHKDFAESFFWIDPKNREKAVSAIVNKALAKQAEDILSLEHNASFKNPRMPKGGGDGKRVPITGNNNYGVKYKF